MGNQTRRKTNKTAQHRKNKSTRKRCVPVPVSLCGRRGRKVGYRSSTTAGEGALCAVCGARAGRHSYYGGLACQSCRAFFRRGTQRQAYQNLRCEKNLDCNITLHSRNRCKACRWTSCIKAGMKVTYVQCYQANNKQDFNCSLQSFKTVEE